MPWSLPNVHKGKKGTKEAPPTVPSAPITYHACSSCPLGSPSTLCSAFWGAPVSSSRAWVPPSYSQESHLWEGVGRSKEGEGKVSMGNLSIETTAEQRGRRERVAGRCGTGPPKINPQLTSREDLAISEIQVQVTSTGVRGVGALGSSGS